MYQMLTQAPNWGEADLSSLRFCTSGGAPLPVPLVEKYGREKGVCFKQGFGMTEYGPGLFALPAEDAIRKAFAAFQAAKDRLEYERFEMLLAVRAELTAEVLAREGALFAEGGAGLPPDVIEATPRALCGVDGTAPDECLRTIPPREHGGNMDIRYMTRGTTVYLPVFVRGALFHLGDVHALQGDGEIVGTGIEVSAE